jgi:hypothetical protein
MRALYSSIFNEEDGMESEMCSQLTEQKRVIPVTLAGSVINLKLSRL